MTSADWISDIKLAKEAHIDGFALNIAPQDSYTDAVLRRAYDAAYDAGNFTMFLQFDYASGGPWPLNRVIKTINRFKRHQAQYRYQHMPLVSTFEGPTAASDWFSIKAQTGCFFAPDWTSLGPDGFRKMLDMVDGALSWDAWPEGPRSKTTESDKAWISALDKKAYIMPVSPWFYTNLAQWNKNWLWRGDDLWHDRWQQVVELQPEMVMILTWNDFGESHYIGPIHKSGIPEGAGRYVLDHPHDGWRTLLPLYISAYKSGTFEPESNTTDPHHSGVLASNADALSYWYRRNPGSSAGNGNTTGNNPGAGQIAFDPADLSEDKIFLTVKASKPCGISIQIGEYFTSELYANYTGLNHFSVPFRNRKGPVRITVSRNREVVLETTGANITDRPEDGMVGWNAYVGSALASGAESTSRLESLGGVLVAFSVVLLNSLM